MTMAQAANVRDEGIGIIVICSIILVVGVILYLGVWLYGRRWIRAGSSSGGSAEPWTLQDLRELRGRGDLSEEEYQAMRAAIIDACRGRRSTSEGAAGQTDNDSSSDNGPDFDLKKSPRA